MTPKAKRPEPTLIVVDDFYRDPDSVREAALSSRYTKYSSGPYEYRTAKPKQSIVRQGVESIVCLIGQDFRKKFIESQFIVETKRNEVKSKRRSWVHFDRCRWVGVLYLSLPKDCEGGTSFYRHRKTGFSRWEELLNYTLSGKGRPRDVFKDSTDLTKWEVTDSVGMVFNRLVLFDSRLFHQATCYFGTTLANARLYQHFAFDQRPDETS